MLNREILFRGKRKGNGEWVEGSYLHLNTGKDYICDGTFWINKEVLNKYKVDPETVGQYTGLTDKNGKKIFEGYIVQIKDFSHGCALNYEQPTSKWVVKWYEDTAKFGIDYMKVLRFDFTESEVIGDTYDNPDCLRKIRTVE